MNLIGSQSYPWWQEYDSQGLSLLPSVAPLFDRLVEAGISTWEPCLSGIADIAPLRDAMAYSKISCVSAYVGGDFISPDWQQTVQDHIGLAKEVSGLGVRILVCNPDPISFQSVVEKSDEVLVQQSRALKVLAEGLGEIGMQLAYHVHQPEMASDGRELHWMMESTVDSPMGLCFDAHWIYRGAGNRSEVVFDVLRRYGRRVISTHLRQSRGGAWTDVLQVGDLDYREILSELDQVGFQGPHILELATEAETKRTHSILDAHRRSARFLQSLLEELRVERGVLQISR